MPIKAEKGIPMPPARGAQTKYPFRTMAVNDSFAVPANSVDPDCFRAYTATKGRKLKRKFSIRATGKSLRVWRVS